MSSARVPDVANANRPLFASEQITASQAFYLLKGPPFERGVMVVEMLERSRSPLCAKRRLSRLIVTARDLLSDL
jgi:hypothetical protein